MTNWLELLLNIHKFINGDLTMRKINQTDYADSFCSFWKLSLWAFNCGEWFVHQILGSQIHLTKKCDAFDYNRKYSVRLSSNTMSCATPIPMYTILKMITSSKILPVKFAAGFIWESKLPIGVNESVWLFVSLASCSGCTPPSPIVGWGRAQHPSVTPLRDWVVDEWMKFAIILHW